VEARRVVSYTDVVRGGCQYFLTHGTIDMDELAASLSISRATLYRVVHGRDQLLGDVLWRMGERELAAARRERTLTGIQGVLQVSRLYCARLAAAQPFRTFLLAEPSTATRVLFAPVGGVHQRVVAVQKEILIEAAQSGDAWLAADLDRLAYLYVRIFESMLYAEMLTGRQLDPDLAERAAAALLTAA
jgi:hypothetical protein